MNREDKDSLLSQYGYLRSRAYADARLTRLENKIKAIQDKCSKTPQRQASKRQHLKWKKKLVIAQKKELLRIMRPPVNEEEEILEKIIRSINSSFKTKSTG